MRRGLSKWVVCLCLLGGQAVAETPSYEAGLAAARAGDYAGAVAQWRPLAEDGHAEAQFNLGTMYETGLGMPKDAAKAAGWYTLAAAQGHASAQYNLGVMYADGRGVPRDDSRAAIWMRKAAERDHAKAQYNLGVFYQMGRGVPEDAEQARLWFERAAANGVSPAGVVDTSTIESIDRKSQGSLPETSDPQESRTSPTDKDQMPPDEGGNSDETKNSGSASAKQDLDSASHADAVAQPPAAAADLAGEPDPDAATSAGPEIANLPNEPLRIDANPPAGARYRIEISETRERTRGDGFVMVQSSQMHVDMAVKDGNGDGRLIEWTYGPATVETAGDSQAAALASELGRLIDGQVVAYHTNERGEVTGLDDPGQLAAFYEKAVERVLDALRAQGADRQLIAAIRANLEPLLSEAYAADSALDLPKLLHFFNGLALAAGETYSRSGVMNVPPSAQGLPSTVNYELKWFDRAAGVAWLHWNQTVDSKQAASAVKRYIEAVAAASGQPTPPEFDIGDIIIADSADYEIDIASGFPRQVIYTRTVELFGFSQTEKRRVRVIR